MKLGIDFGTTNSAVAALGADGAPELLELTPGERVQRTVVHCSPQGAVTLGNDAFRAYLAADLTGRFLRSLKSFLSHDVPRTRLGRDELSFTEIVAAYLRFLREGAERVTGEVATEVVVGRPVLFHQDPGRHARALGQLERAIHLAELPNPRLQLEPVAAALQYARTLRSERIVLVGDFGGGTADFAVLRLGAAPQVLGTSGVAQAGDALDGRFLDVFLLHHFGRGATCRVPHTDTYEPWTHSVTRQIQRLYDIHHLRDPELRDRLERVRDRMGDPRVVDRLIRLVFDDLGYPLAWSIERAKQALSHAPRATFRFAEYYDPRLDIEEEVDHDRLARGSAAILAAYRDGIDLAVRRAGITVEVVDDVYLTGGTSQLPFVRELFAELVGADRLHSGDSFTSVCEGLAVS